MLRGDPNEKGTNAWIPEEAGKRAEIYLIWRAYDAPEHCTLGDLWDFATATQEEIIDTLLEMAESGCADGYVSRLAAKTLQEQTDENQLSQNSWIMSALTEAVSMFGKGSVLRDFTSETTVDL